MTGTSEIPRKHIDRNNHKLKVVNIDVEIKKWGKCQGRKAGVRLHSKKKRKEKWGKRGWELLNLRY